MSQSSINQRIKFLLDNSQLSVRAFSELIGQKAANTQNYVGARASMPGADYLQSIIEHFENINPGWLLSGKGEPFISESSNTTTNIKKITGGAVHSGTGNQLITLEACQRELESTKRDAASLQKEVDLLRQQLTMKDQLIAAKEEMLSLLRSQFNRPN